MTHDRSTTPGSLLPETLADGGQRPSLANHRLAARSHLQRLQRAGMVCHRKEGRTDALPENSTSVSVVTLNKPYSTRDFLVNMQNRSFFSKGLMRLLIATATLALLALASPALGAQTRSYSSSFGTFAPADPQALAVDQSNGDVYALDTAYPGKIFRFDAAGAPKNFTATGTNVTTLTGGGVDAGPSAAQIAIDNSGGPADGNIYVTTLNASFAWTVAVYDKDGDLVGELDGSTTPNAAYGETCGVAVDQANGNVYVGDFSGNVWRYTPSGATVTNADYSGGIATTGISPCSVAADSGKLYAAGWSTGPVNRYAASDFATGPIPPSLAGTEIDATATALSVDPSTGELYVDEGNQIHVFDSSGASQYTFGSAADFGADSAGVAAQGEGGKAYVADRTTGQIDVYGPVPLNGDPTAATRNATGIGIDTATLNANVNPHGEAVTDCRFDYTDDADFQANGFTNAQHVACDPDPGAGSAAVAVSAQIGGLTPGKSYDFRIVATNAFGTANGQARTFTTDVIASTTAASGTTHHTNATLNGHIEPHGDTVTDCFFDYGSDTTYGQTVDCAEGDDFAAVSNVSAFVNGLAPGQPVHFRLHLLTAGHGVTVGADRSFAPPVGQSPTLTSQDAAALTGTSATLHALVDPEGGTVTDCHFEYVPDGQFSVDQFGTSSSIPCDPGPGGGSGDVAVHGDLAALTPGTSYHFRIVATNAGGTSTGAGQTFVSKGPRLGVSRAEPVTSTTATLRSLINPAGVVTTYHFEYGPDTAYGHSTADVQIGGASDREVQAEISDLGPGRTYHFRLVATNGDATSVGPDASFTTGGVTDTCPNAALRTGFGYSLPDCRAYEQATPADKFGSNAQHAYNITQASRNGDRVSFADPGGLPTSGAGTTKPPVYFASRDGAGTGWSSANTLPATPAGLAAASLGWSDDLAASLALTFTGPTNRDLKLRGSITGVQQAVGSGTSPTNDQDTLASFADDATHALFQSPAVYAPGGVPGGQNLYELKNGVISPAGRVPAGGATSCDDDAGPACVLAPNGAFAGSYDWLKGDTENAMPGGYLQNTLSRNGSRIAFTSVGTGRLYLRQDDHRTTQISASQRSTVDPNGGDQPAAWMDSTPDGKTTFFTSREALTNQSLPVPAWGIDRANVDGTSAEESFVPVNAVDLTVDAAHLYWLDAAAHRIGRANLDGTGVDRDFISGLNAPQSLAVDGSFIYWGDGGDGTRGGGSIGRAHLDGSSVDASFIEGVTAPHGLALGTGHIYWLNDPVFDTRTGTSPGNIGRANTDGTSVDQAFVTDVIQVGGQGLAVDASHIYWGNPQNSLIGRSDIDGTNANIAFITSSPGGSVTGGVAVDASHIYFGVTSGVVRAELDGSSATVLVGGTAPTAVSVNAGHIYWANHLRDANGDLYAYNADASSGSLTDLTVDADAGTRGADVVGLLGASADGQIVYFAANGVLAPGGTAGQCQPGGFDGGCDIYVSDHGHIRWIARLNDQGNFNLVGATQPGTQPKTSRVSANGVLVLTSSSSLTGGDNQPAGQLDCNFDNCTEIYRYSPGSEHLTCVSCQTDGSQPRGDAVLESEGNAFGALPNFSFLTRNVSADGNRVFFDTNDSLLPVDRNGGTACPSRNDQNGRPSVQGCRDVYEWEAGGTGSCHSSVQNGGCLYLLSSGTGDRKGNDDSYFGDASASGDDVFIFTSQPLVPQDTDQLVDAYDVRVGGGVVAQHQAPPPPCTENACQGSPTPPPPLIVAASVSFVGPGNVPPSIIPGVVPTVSKPKTVRGTSTLLSITVPSDGKLTVTGSGLKTSAKTTKAKRTYRLRATLTAKAKAKLKKQHTLKVKARVLFRPSTGASHTVTVTLTFKTAPTKKKGR
jgi:hypothetical protein